MVINKMGRTILRGRWKSAVAAQFVQAVAVSVAIGVQWWIGSLAGAVGYALSAVLVLVVDLCAVSPFKWGVAAFYWRSIYRPDTTLWTCLTEAYHHHYRRAIEWRWCYWRHGILWLAVCSLPWALGNGTVAWLDTLAITPLTEAAAIFFQVVTAVALPGGWVAWKLCMLGYLPAVYLMIAGMDAGEAFAWSRKLMKGTYNQTVWYFCGFGWWLPLYLLIIPWPMISPLLEGGKAGLVYRRLRTARREQNNQASARANA